MACERAESIGEIATDENVALEAEYSLSPMELSKPFAELDPPILDAASHCDSADSGDEVATNCGAIAGPSARLPPEAPPGTADACAEFASDNCFLAAALLNPVGAGAGIEELGCGPSSAMVSVKAPGNALHVKSCKA